MVEQLLELVEVELQFRARSVPPPPPPLEVECTSQLLVQYRLLTRLLHLRMPCWWPDGNTQWRTRCTPPSQPGMGWWTPRAECRACLSESCLSLDMG